MTALPFHLLRAKGAGGQQEGFSYCTEPPPPQGSPSLRSGSQVGIAVRDSTGTSRGSPPSTNIMCSRAAPFRRIWWESFWGQGAQQHRPVTHDWGSRRVWAHGTWALGLST